MYAIIIEPLLTRWGQVRSGRRYSLVVTSKIPLRERERRDDDEAAHVLGWQAATPSPPQAAGWVELDMPKSLSDGSAKAGQGRAVSEGTVQYHHKAGRWAGMEEPGRAGYRYLQNTNTNNEIRGITENTR